MSMKTDATTVNLPPQERFGTVSVTPERRDDFDDFIGNFDDSEGEGNARCLWDGSVCSESVTHQITFALYQEVDNPYLDSHTFCARHYAVELAEFVHYHSEQCPITLASHLVSFGALDSNQSTGN